MCTHVRFGAPAGVAGEAVLIQLSFTPQAALAGGLVLGVATLAKLLLTGRILGISGAVK